MPIRINLKELFGSDSQGVIVDKLNYNFNKLLELGIGLPGEKGISGIQGPAGPAGPAGPVGTSGNKWFVGSGNPNGQTFAGLQDGDFYLRSDNSEIWQYDETSNSWTNIVDLEGVVNDYLTLSGSTFVRGIGDVSPSDDRFIVFPNRGNDATAVSTDGIGGTSDNDVLFLNNFNEKYNVVDIDNFPTSTSDLYTAIEKIFVDDTSGVPGRYHLELGSLFADTQGPNTNILSSLKHNLKFRHVVDDLGGSYQYPSSNDYLYIGKFSLSKTESQATSELDYNSLFEFNTSKFNAEGASIIREEVSLRFGPVEALGEYNTDALADGVNIIKGSEIAEFGITSNFSSNNTSVDGGSYLLINQSGVDGTVILGDTYQDEGNIVQLNSTGFRTKGSSGSYYTTPNGRGSHYNIGIGTDGNRLYTVQGRSPYVSGGSKIVLSDSSLAGQLYQWNIQDGVAVAGNVQGGGGLSSGSSFSGAGCSDLVVNGDYIYVVNNQVNSLLTESSPLYLQCNLQVLRIDPVHAGVTNPFASTGVGENNTVDKITSIVGWGSTDYIQELDGAWRVELMGSHLAIGANKLRDMSLAGNPINEDTYISLVDVSNPAYPVLDASVLLENTHVLDMMVYEDFVIALTLKFNGVSASGGKIGTIYTATGHEVSVEVFKKFYNGNHQAPTSSSGRKYLIERQVKHTIATFTGTINYGTEDNIATISKIGSIANDGKTLYAAYDDNIYVFPIENTSWASFGDVATFQYTANSEPKPYDMKAAGGYLYILHGDAAAVGDAEEQYQSEYSYLDKINISNPNSMYTEWSQQMDAGFGGYKFEIVGNNIYVASQSYVSGGSERPGLITLEVDGYVSGHAKIGNLRTDQSKVMMDIEVGGRAKIAGAVNLGQSLSVKDDLFVGGRVKVRPLRALDTSTDHKRGDGLVKFGQYDEIEFATSNSKTNGSYIFRMYDPNVAGNTSAFNIHSYYGTFDYVAMSYKDRMYFNANNSDSLLTFGNFGNNDQFRMYMTGWTGGLPSGLTNPGFFVAGDCRINGNLSKATGSFNIPHPLESKKETHRLVHSFIEGPQADNIYRGKIQLVNGSASINLDLEFNMTEGTFEALNREIQCFTSNESGWDNVRGSVSGNVLTIECQNTSSSDLISWLVIGERQDDSILDSSITDDNGKLIVEVENPAQSESNPIKDDPMNNPIELDIDEDQP